MIRHALAAVLLLACSGKTDPPAATSGAGSASGAGSPSGTGSSSDAGSGSASASASASAPGAGSGAAIVADDPAVRARYRAGMKAGRKATDAKEYAEAIMGFDAALAAKPSDPRALTERGFARLRDGKDLDGASRDFDLAAGGTKDPKLLSQIWFNRGLIAEKRGEAENAIASFVIADNLRPTAAAKRKITGRSMCPVTVERDFTEPPAMLLDEGATAAVKAVDWVALAERLFRDDDDRRAFLEKDDPTLPAALEVDDFGELARYIVWRQGDQLRALPIAAAMGGRCPGSVGLDIISTTPTLIHARATESMEGGHTYMCRLEADGEIFECMDKPGEQPAGTACLGASTVIRDVVIELATSKVLIAAEQPYANRPAVASLVGAGLKLTGLGCDRIIPLR